MQNKRSKSKYAHLYKGQKQIPTPDHHTNASAGQNVQPSEAAPQNLTPSQRLAELEDAREELMEKLLKFKEVLNSKVLMANRTELEKREISTLTNAINSAAVELDNKNLGEGSMTLNVAALNAILMLHGQVNELRWLLYGLQKKVNEAEQSEDENEG
jgi:hypothetical protein